MNGDAALDRLAARFPGWYFWRGVTGLWYGRRPMTSPPVVCRAATAEGLVPEVQAAIRQRRL